MGLSVEKKIAITAIGVGGILFAGCDVKKSPDFPNCAYDNGNKSNTFYLRENALGGSVELKIGDVVFKREEKNGPLTQNGHVMEPNIEVFLFNPDDGRDYDITFSEHEVYTKADVFARCKIGGRY